MLGTPTEETWPGVSSICKFIQAFNPPIQPKVFINVVIFVPFHFINSGHPIINAWKLIDFVGPSWRVPYPWTCWSWSSFGNLTASFTLLFPFLRESVPKLLNSFIDQLIVYVFVLDRKCFACAQMAGFQLMKLLTIRIFDIDHPWWSSCFDYYLILCVLLTEQSYRILGILLVYDPRTVYEM